MGQQSLNTNTHTLQARKVCVSLQRYTILQVASFPSLSKTTRHPPPLLCPAGTRRAATDQPDEAFTRRTPGEAFLLKLTEAGKQDLLNYLNQTNASQCVFFNLILFQQKLVSYCSTYQKVAQAFWLLFTYLLISFYDWTLSEGSGTLSSAHLRAMSQWQMDAFNRMR